MEVEVEALTAAGQLLHVANHSAIDHQALVLRALEVLPRRSPEEVATMALPKTIHVGATQAVSEVDSMVVSDNHNSQLEWRAWLG